MPVQFRTYSKSAGISKDYCKVRDFFVRIGCAEFTYARWDWMATHSYLEKNAVGRIGLWESVDQIVAIATFDTKSGTAYCLTLPEFEYLKEEMLLYAKKNLSNEKGFGIIISDQDHHFQEIASNLGFIASENKENDAIFYLDKTSTDYLLPKGFRITSMKETYDPFNYRRVLWKGFNHELNGEGEMVYSEVTEKEVSAEMHRLNVDLDLKIAVVSPDGDFVSYCGMWYDSHIDFAVIEPVATVPEFRRRGLGKAAVLEGIKRVGELGAKRVFVGSSQQFYYSIGMRPYATATEWKCK